MIRISIPPAALATALFAFSWASGEEPAETFLRQLPPGLFLTRSTSVAPQQAQAIGAKLGGTVARLSNSFLQVHGRPIQLNAVTAPDEANAKALQAALSKNKPFPFCLRSGNVVIEYVGKEIDAALATKTSYELGLLPKPKRVRYRVAAEVATVDRADYMACTPLFNQFLAMNAGPNENTGQQIDALAKRFKFGTSLTLRSPKIGNESATHTFEPRATGGEELGDTIRYSFDRLPNRRGIPYVTLTVEITIDDTGLRETATAPAAKLTAPTPSWPADDPGVRSLAQQITAGGGSNGAKAMAILEWLTPGKNLRYSGQTGSRWGVTKVLQQKFGRCWDFADCFVTLCRAAGVPSRQVGGWLYGSEGHIWAEFYREGKGWQQVDATGGGKLRCGIYHIPYFTSEDGEMPILYVAMPRIETVATP